MASTFGSLEIAKSGMMTYNAAFRGIIFNLELHLVVKIRV